MEKAAGIRQWVKPTELDIPLYNARASSAGTDSENASEKEADFTPPHESVHHSQTTQHSQTESHNKTEPQIDNNKYSEQSQTQNSNMDMGLLLNLLAEQNRSLAPLVGLLNGEKPNLMTLLPLIMKMNAGKAQKQNASDGASGENRDTRHGAENHVMHHDIGHDTIHDTTVTNTKNTPNTHNAHDAPKKFINLDDYSIIK